MMKRSQLTGVSWRMMSATVKIPGTDSTGVLVDGDTATTYVINMIGEQLNAGDRVYVVMTPPASNYIIGRVPNENGFDKAPVYFVAAQTDLTGITTGGATAFPDGVAIFNPGRAFRVEWGGDCTLSLSTNVLGLDILFNGATGIFGGAFGPSGAAFSVATYGHRIIRNSTSAVEARIMNVKATVNASGTASWLGAAARARYLAIFDIGNAYFYPGAIEIP
jgi:hypothetical protein